ncbi:MAG: glycosyltransferase [Magnetococcales bacterium]|nr:glycosyltransferase [Magnetococcales bacterium]
MSNKDSNNIKTTIRQIDKVIKASVNSGLDAQQIKTIISAIRTINQTTSSLQLSAFATRGLSKMREDYATQLLNQRGDLTVEITQILLVLDIIADGFDIALELLIRRIWLHRLPVPPIAQWLWDQGLTETINWGVLPNTMQRIAVENRYVAVNVALTLSAFYTNKTREWMDSIATMAIVPLLLNEARIGSINCALYIESLLAQYWIKLEETEEHYEKCYSLWVETFVEAGEKISRSLPTINTIHYTETDNQMPVIGFFLQQESMLAHVEMLLTALTAVQKQQTKYFVPRVYTLTGNDENMQKAFSAINVEVVSGRNTEIVEGFIKLRSQLHQDKVAALVWISVPNLLAFAKGLGVAPKLIWWSMKFHPTAFEGLDGYFTISHGLKTTSTIMNRSWRIIPTRLTIFSKLTDPGTEKTARKLKQNFGTSVVAGTFSREETIATKPFLSLITKILQKNKQLHWLYTGKKNHLDIQKAIIDAGVSSQASYIGWIDTRLYSQIIDIYVDCWPLGGGVTVTQAMACGKPYVYMTNGGSMVMDTMIADVLVDPEIPQETANKLRQIFGNGEFLLAAIDENQYMQFVQKLIEDVEFRRVVGNAYRTWTEKFMTDSSALADIFSNHILQCAKP